VQRAPLRFFAASRSHPKTAIGNTIDVEIAELQERNSSTAQTAEE